MKIVKLKDLAESAFAEIKQYQDGTKKIIKTGAPYIDEVGIGYVNGSVITIAAGSGIGKSTELSTILDYIMDKEHNPDADKYISLNVSLEMRMFSLILRGLKGQLNKDKKKILEEEFTEDELSSALKYIESLSDDRRYISQVPTSVNQFYTEAKKFLEEHIEAESVIISIDHIVLIQSDKSDGKNQVVEKLIEAINSLKMEFSNVSFILLSQTNSDITKRIAENNRNSQPKDSDLFYSSFTFQISDYVVCLVNPDKLGIKEYSSLNPERYPHLSDLFLEPDKKGRVSLTSNAVIYKHLLKCREGDLFYRDIFYDKLDAPKGWEEPEREKPKTFSLEALENSFENADDSPF